MKQIFLWLLNYSYGGTVVIKLNRQEIAESETYADFEDYIRDVLEDRYSFNLGDCSWMTSEEYIYERYGF